ncbi:MAG: hypothetical protein ACLUHE_16235 [Christensenellales bacterium]
MRLPILMRPAMYGAYHHITVLGKEMRPATIRCGRQPVRENNDKLAIDRQSLSKPAHGDRSISVATLTRAHGLMGYGNYNTSWQELPSCSLRENGSVQMIRRSRNARRLGFGRTSTFSKQSKTESLAVPGLNENAPSFPMRAVGKAAFFSLQPPSCRVHAVFNRCNTVFVFEIHAFRGGWNHAPVGTFDKSDAARIQTVRSQPPFGCGTMCETRPVHRWR